MTGGKSLLEGRQLPAVSKSQKRLISITFDTRQVHKCPPPLIFPRNIFRASMRCFVRRVKCTCLSRSDQLHQGILFFWHHLNVLFATVLGGNEIITAEGAGGARESRERVVRGSMRASYWRGYETTYSRKGVRKVKGRYTPCYHLGIVDAVEKRV